MKQNDLFPTLKRNTISGVTVTIFVHNVRPLSRDVDDIISYNSIINKEIVGFSTSQMNSSNSTCKIIETLNF